MLSKQITVCYQNSIVIQIVCLSANYRKFSVRDIVAVVGIISDQILNDECSKRRRAQSSSRYEMIMRFILQIFTPCSMMFHFARREASAIEKRMCDKVVIYWSRCQRRVWKTTDDKRWDPLAQFTNKYVWWTNNKLFKVFSQTELLVIILYFVRRVNIKRDKDIDEISWFTRLVAQQVRDSPPRTPAQSKSTTQNLVCYSTTTERLVFFLLPTPLRLINTWMWKR